MTREASRVLLVDDEDTFRRSTGTLLEQEGYRCDLAQDVQEASQALSQVHDAMISDLRMTGNLQFEFLRDVRARFPTLPIVLVTGYPSVHTAVQALRLGFTDYLLKPVDWLDLLRSVNQAVEKGRYLRMTDVARNDLDRQGTAVDHAREIVNRAGTMPSQTGLAWSLEAFLSQSVGNIALLSDGVRSVMMRPDTGGANEPVDVCRLMDCPRLSAYRAALESTVQVLEKTKSSFRSKDLGQLRQKLQQLLKEDPR